MEYLGESNVLQNFLDEVVSTSNVKVSKRDKIDRLQGSKSMQLAKEKNDPVYKKYVKYNKKRIALKKKIMSKYGTKARTIARETIGKGKS